VANDTKVVTTVDLWRPLLDAVSWFEHAKVSIINGRHPDGDMYRYEANGGFEGLAKMKSGEWRSMNGNMKLSWQRAKAAAGEPVPEWQIAGWKTEQMRYQAGPRRLFAEVLDTALRPEFPALPSHCGVLPRGHEVAAPSVFCAHLGEPQGGHRRGRHRWRWF
jgi:hypothetical protein